ncbi:putative methyltransferase DDB_G0268948 [Lissotriton helveticus]
MPFRYFERKEHSSIYQKYMIREPEEMRSIIFSYLEKKKNPCGLAVDVGCGTGQSTHFLAAHFQKVVGIDISESQIQEAKSFVSAPNLDFIVGCAENLPFDDNSVDLITSSVAAHWFNIKEFLREGDRVLKPSGCLALYSLHPHYELYYKDCSQRITDALNEFFQFLLYEHGAGSIVGLLIAEYKEIFDAVHYKDKTSYYEVEEEELYLCG